MDTSRMTFKRIGKKLLNLNRMREYTHLYYQCARLIYPG
jgi:hypothetical protein